MTRAIVIGAGVAGLCAALEVADAGGEVTIVEATDRHGASGISIGGCLIAGSPLQAQRGIEDSPQRALADWQRRSGEGFDEGWARAYLRDGPAGVYGWCESRLGIAWDDVRPQEGDSVPRWHLPAGGGAAIVAGLVRALARHGVSVSFASRAERLLVEGGRVVGVEVGGGERGAAAHRAELVIVASGGFVSNREMLSRLVPRMRSGSRMLSGGADTAVGLGHALLSQVDGQFAGMANVWVYPVGTPDPHDQKGLRGLVIRGVESEIWVNRLGRRFHDERLRGGITGTPALLAQPGATAFGIFDAVEAQRLRVLDNTAYGGPLSEDPDRCQRLAAESRYVHVAATIGELAQLAGVPDAALEFTVQAYNDNAPGTLPGAADVGRPIETPPFYAVQYFPIVQKNLGGICTDLRGQVVRVDGGLIEGLYAAGEVAGMAGGHLNGQNALEGAMFGPCLYSGRVAGQQAAVAASG